MTVNGKTTLGTDSDSDTTSPFEPLVADFTIENFWTHRLRASNADPIGRTKGWQLIEESGGTFKEAPLYLNDDFTSHFSPSTSPMLLVSAPGAVGKTTLAKRIAYRTGAIYIDLAQSEPVGGHTLSGGLVRAGVYERWQAETTTVLVDGLDEARLRVTQEAFESFLGDVRELSVTRTLPTVLFGRSGSIQDAWLILALNGFEVPVLEIGYFGVEDAINFAKDKLRTDYPKRIHPETDKRAIALLLERIRDQTESDGDRFAGYAPVLQAVAERVAKESNPAAFVAEIEGGAQKVTLQDVASSIIERERTKLDPLNFDDSELSNRLYLADEQLHHLAARVYGIPGPELPEMSPIDAQTYENALKTWVADHPFLDGHDLPSSAVFDAVIATWTLRHSPSRRAKAIAVERELARGIAANPILSEIYTNELFQDYEPYIPADHIGIVYLSLRARLSLGDAASMLIEDAESSTDVDILRAEVEITQLRRNEQRPRVVELTTDQQGVIRLGTHIEDVEVIAADSCVEFGAGDEAMLVAPISIQCELLSIESKKLIVEPSPTSSMGAVYLEAKELSGFQMTSVPVLRGNATLAACWPEVRRHPWTNFAVEQTVVDDPKVEEALRRLRKFVISFRSHGRGGLARFKGKVEHRRMTKGTGQGVLELMLREKILSYKDSDSMYFLHSDVLAAHTGLSYINCVEWRFGEKAIEFVRHAI